MNLGKKIFAFVLTLCILSLLIPDIQLKADDNFVTYRFEGCDGFQGNGFDISYKIGRTVKVIIDRSKLKADVTFVRNDLSDSQWKYLEKYFPDEYEFAKRFYGQTCHAICDVVDYKNDNGDNGRLDYELKNFVWDDKPFLWTVDNDGKKLEDNTIIVWDVLEDRPIVYIRIPHVKAGSNINLMFGGSFGYQIGNYVYNCTTNGTGIWYHDVESEKVVINVTDDNKPTEEPKEEPKKEPEEEFTIEFDANGGSGTMEAMTVKKGFCSLPECKFTKEGYTFRGWKREDGQLFLPGGGFYVESNITLPAEWKEIQKKDDNNENITEEPKEDSKEDPKVNPTENPKDGSTKELIEEPVEKPTEDPGENTVIEPTKKPVEEPKNEPIQDTQKNDGSSKKIVTSDEVYFGHYEQDGNKKNGKEPIEWIVLENKGDTLVLMSKDILVHRVFDNSKKTTVTWADSSIRKWLNKTFLKSAFTAKERKNIVKRKSKADKNPNSSYGRSGGKTVKDKVSILSSTEVLKYFKGKDLIKDGLNIYNPRLVAEPSNAIVKNSKNKNGLKKLELSAWAKVTYKDMNYPDEVIDGSYSEWWLRTPGPDNNEMMIVYSHGNISYTGLVAHSKIASTPGIRPVIEVKASAVTEIKNKDKKVKKSSTGAILSDIPDKTGYEPKNWSWEAEGEGYGLKYFTSGKYISSDGLSVIYLESSDGGDYFIFQIFGKGKGENGIDTTIIDNDTGSPNILAWYTSQTEADCEDILHLKSIGNGTLIVTKGSTQDMGFKAFEDHYYLAQEKI